MYGIALDLGTSGIRAQAMELESGRVLSTAIKISKIIEATFINSMEV